jgi:hypothetical protein
MAGFNNELEVVSPRAVHLADCPRCGKRLRRDVLPDADPPAWELAPLGDG